MHTKEEGLVQLVSLRHEGINSSEAGLMKKLMLSSSLKCDQNHNNHGIVKSRFGKVSQMIYFLSSYSQVL